MTASVTQGEAPVHWAAASVLWLVPWISDMTASHCAITSPLVAACLLATFLLSVLSVYRSWHLSRYTFFPSHKEDVIFIFIFVKYKRKCAVFRVFFSVFNVFIFPFSFNKSLALFWKTKQNSGSGSEILNRNFLIFLQFPQQGKSYTRLKEASPDTPELTESRNILSCAPFLAECFCRGARLATPSFGRWCITSSCTVWRVKAKSEGSCQHGGMCCDCWLHVCPHGPQTGSEKCVFTPGSWHGDQAARPFPPWALIPVPMDLVWSHADFTVRDSGDPMCPQLVTLHANSTEEKQPSLWQESIAYWRLWISMCPLHIFFTYGKISKIYILTSPGARMLNSCPSSSCIKERKILKVG